MMVVGIKSQNIKTQMIFNFNVSILSVGHIIIILIVKYVERILKI